MKSSFGACEPDDFLTPHLGEVPAFRALLRAVECKPYAGLELTRPVLDLGCGDGHFASVAFGRVLDVGLDSSPKMVREAAVRGAHRQVLVGDGEALPFASASFGTVIANSVLEHIPRVEVVLGEIARVLRERGSLAFTVPSEHYESYLLGNAFLRKLGFPSLGRAYSRWFNRYAPHHHLHPPERWEEMLAGAGLQVAKHSYYFSPRATWVFEGLHYWSVPSLLTRRLLGRWALLRGPGRPYPLRRLLQGLYQQEAPGLAAGAYSFFLCRKAGR